MQIAIAAHSGEYNEEMKIKVKEFLEGVSNECKNPVLLLGGYWGLMKEVVDQACNLGLRVILLLPIENEDVSPPDSVIKIKTGMEYRARSIPLIRSSDAVVALGGGVGTEIEILMGYGMGKPVFVLSNTGFSTDKLIKAFPDYFDHREVVKVSYIDNPRELAKTLCSLKSSETKDFG
ncbi:LOG family protein [Acidianus brierleyi]|uniref:LOG family protein n=1 Tax=Acidianus brierleyi TaxID=41673 RepID=A0A2U9IGR5_9CREN|nr:LOG family protein [Acidianus brierleyi]AWR95124.1 LOG family protein [Acidianus brierleyi]